MSSLKEQEKIEANEIREKFIFVENELQKFIIERVDEIHGITLSILSGLNILFLGSPGIAKSYLIDNYVKFIYDFSLFKIQLTKFSTPEELWGPFSIPSLKNGEFVRVTKGKFPEADIAFIDEIFKANSGILNSLLLAINEREFINNGERIKIPLLTLIGASNEIPDSQDGLDAMYDRMVLKYISKPIQENYNFVNMLRAELPNIKPIISLKEIYTLRDYIANNIILDEEAEEILVRLRSSFIKENIVVTDRTWKNCIKLLKAEAFFRGDEKINATHFDVLQHALWKSIDRKKQIELLILNISNPIKYQLMEYLEEIKNIVKNIEKEEDETAKISMAVEGTKKIKELIEKMNKAIDETEKIKKNIRDLRKLLKKAEEQLLKCISFVGVKIS